MDSLNHARLILETVLLSSAQPLTLAQLKQVLGDGLEQAVIRRLLTDLQQAWQGRGVELVQLAEGWRFRTRPVWCRVWDLAVWRWPGLFLPGLPTVMPCAATFPRIGGGCSAVMPAPLLS